MITLMLREAWAAVAANRLRSALTMLGMIIGIASVIVMLALGKGAEVTVEREISSMGSNLLVVVAGGPKQNGGGRTADVVTLTTQDAQAITELPGVLASAPFSSGNVQVSNSPHTRRVQVFGTSNEYLNVRNWGVKSGTGFSAYEMESAARVVLLGTTVSKQLFKDEDPVGRKVTLDGNPYLVNGVLTPKGKTVDGYDQDDVVLVPISTANRKIFGSQFPASIRVILVKAESREALDSLESKVSDLLRQRHRLRPDQDPDFTINNLTALVSVAETATQALGLLLAGIASVSLLVGGVGIMNIMLVSVTERTREIGLRAAIGAPQSSILLQFLVESIILSLGGCVLGVTTGVVLAWLISTQAPIPIIVTLSAVLMAVGVSLTVGLVFGYSPARRASLLEPIDALRAP